MPGHTQVITTNMCEKNAENISIVGMGTAGR
jgi:hypothetical protein